MTGLRTGLAIASLYAAVASGAISPDAADAQASAYITQRPRPAGGGSAVSAVRSVPYNFAIPPSAASPVPPSAVMMTDGGRSAPGLAAITRFGIPLPTSGTHLKGQTASDQGTSYAVIGPPDRFGPAPPPSTGQSTVAGEALPSRVLTATLPTDPTIGISQTPGNNALAQLSPPAVRISPRTPVLAEGQRLGGGTNTPSYEAIIYDPRDLLDYRVAQFENPAGANGP